ncbi:hypothetical protein Mgra_00005952 [Meloidogyne graminicola]|uniref:BED-type domain-containing protein n=1 Tax=Meloidogyne graminicola TaxID=189291 RepID=A0A8S9ZMU0_9BILA|nr:hypothetical protein Mgra_00005952 [Meloidogyne graminicola]
MLFNLILIFLLINNIENNTERINGFIYSQFRKAKKYFNVYNNSIYCTLCNERILSEDWQLINKDNQNLNINYNEINNYQQIPTTTTTSLYHPMELNNEYILTNNQNNYLSNEGINLENKNKGYNRMKELEEIFSTPSSSYSDLNEGLNKQLQIENQNNLFEQLINQQQQQQQQYFYSLIPSSSKTLINNPLKINQNYNQLNKFNNNNFNQINLNSNKYKEKNIKNKNKQKINYFKTSKALNFFIEKLEYEGEEIKHFDILDNGIYCKICNILLQPEGSSDLKKHNEIHNNYYNLDKKLIWEKIVNELNNQNITNFEVKEKGILCKICKNKNLYTTVYKHALNNHNKTPLHKGNLLEQENPQQF